MLRQSFSFILINLLAAYCAAQTPTSFVNPFIGTDFHGHTYPGATLPFGAVQLSPDTRRGNWDACSGYHYSDSAMFGFSHTHLSGTGCIDLGDVLFHPTTQPLHLKAKDCIYNPLPFSHKKETASPGYYKVHFDETQITAELTTTERVGVHRYTFPKSDHAKIIIDLGHCLDNEQIDSLMVQIINPNEFAGLRISTGWVANQHIYFSARLSKPFRRAQLISSGNQITNTSQVSGKNIQLVLEFHTSEKESIEVFVGTSLVSIQNAFDNRIAEVPIYSFDRVRKQALDKWNKALGAFQVETKSKQDKEIFYSSLYHTLVVPNVTSDVNGAYRGHNMKIEQVLKPDKMLSTLSLWDTYRAWNPLMTLTNKKLVTDIIKSMLRMYDENGVLPVWPLASGETGTMIGYHAVSVIADAYLKGIRDYDVHKAYEAMKATADRADRGRSYYAKEGFIPSNSFKESVSRLLEYAYDDWCIAQMAKDLGKKDDYHRFIKRSFNYQNVFDGNSGFFRGKRMDGNWTTPFEPLHAGRDYTEANAWQYRFYVPHNVAGLINLMGGKEKFINALDQLFNEKSVTSFATPDITGLMGQYAHGNEPSHHVAYLYNYVGQPWKSQALTRQILKDMYAARPDGIIGNEDCGQMSAWYIMSAMGFYPVCPGSGEYVLTTPLFDKLTVVLHNGEKLVIQANNPHKNVYIKKVTFNGKEITDNYITHNQLMKGGHLNYELSPKPNTLRGSLIRSAPFSQSQKPTVSVPFVKQDLYLFDSVTECSIGCATEGALIRYTTDNKPVTEQSPVYNGTFKIGENTVVRARGYKNGLEPGPELIIAATKAQYKKALNLSPKKTGVSYNYYQGKFKNTSEMLQSAVVKSGEMAAIQIHGMGQEDFYGFEFLGYIFVPSDGLYDFYTGSDDGSVLYIAGEKLVDNDGSHGFITATGRIALKKGFHNFRLLYFEDYEGQQLEVGWKKANLTKFEKIRTEDIYTQK